MDDEGCRCRRGDEESTLMRCAGSGMVCGAVSASPMAGGDGVVVGGGEWYDVADGGTCVEM